MNDDKYQWVPIPMRPSRTNFSFIIFLHIELLFSDSALMQLLVAMEAMLVASK